MTDEIARSAVMLWPIEVVQLSLAAHRENIVYRVEGRNGLSWALRLHRPGYHDVSALQSEVVWMAALAERGIRLPTPLLSHAGHYSETVDGLQIDVLSWLPGRPMGTATTPLNVANRSQTFFELGVALAKLHMACDDWTPPPTFKRHSWDLEGLVGEAPFWGRFWDNPLLSNDERALLVRARAISWERLSRAKLDYGLIHADPVRENVLLHDDNVFLIDFDDGGFGYRLFDLATVLLKCRLENDIAMLTSQLIAGYHAVRPLETREIDLMLALRAFTYLGWIVPRLTESWAPQRLQRFKADALHYAEVLASA